MTELQQQWTLLQLQVVETNQEINKLNGILATVVSKRITANVLNEPPLQNETLNTVLALTGVSEGIALAKASGAGMLDLLNLARAGYGVGESSLLPRLATDISSGSMGSVGTSGSVIKKLAYKEIDPATGRPLVNIGDGSAKSAVAADSWVKPSGWRLPATNGSWAGTPGNSVWNSLNADVNAVTGGSGIPFVNGYPNFSQWSQGTFTFNNLTGTSSDFSLVYRSIANEYNLGSQTAAKNLLRDLSLTPHHVEDGVTIQLIPTDLHSNVPHVGGASLLRNGQ